MIRHLAGMAEIVEDVDAALEYYTGVLGLELERRMNDDYAMLKVPGVLHFGVWSREAAAEATFGSRDQADRVALGFTIEFEMDNLDAASKTLEQQGAGLTHPVRTEPWGQKVTRMHSPGGAIVGFAETPWARKISQPLETSEE